MSDLARRCFTACIVASLILLAAPAWAQEFGSLSGRVVDPDGAPLPGVAVTLDSTLVPEQTTYTQANGSFRFPGLPPGTDAYVLTFVLEGFQTVVQEDLDVRVEIDATLEVTLQLSAVEETVTVAGMTPIVDVKETGTGTNITEEYMQSIPSARDPWVMMQQTPGMQVDRENIGGSESGQQSFFFATGSRFSDTIWTYDGAEITDMLALGGSPMYYDFDAFEEISISTGGNDPSIATGGVRINFVTKRGGSEWRGSGRFYVTDGEFQSRNVGDPETGELIGEFTAEELFPGYIGNSIDNIRDFGGEVGGPVIPDRAFVWGSYGKQDIEQNVGTTSDDTQLTNIHAKSNIHVSDSLVLNYTFIDANKTKQGRGASALRPQSATWNQGGNCCIHTGKTQWTIDDNNYVEGSYNFTRISFFLEPQGGRDAQVSWDLATGAWDGSFAFYNADRRLKNARVDANSYIAGSGVDHELKYGFSWRDAETSSVWGWPSGAIAIFFDGAPFGALLAHNALDNYKGTRTGLYVGDTISTDRLTINAGLRYDHQDSESLPSSVEAHPFAPELMPAQSFPGDTVPFAWVGLSPRVGLTYRLGDERTILRANVARYYAQQFNGEFHLRNTTFGPEMIFFWNDADGDAAFERGETVGDPWFISAGFDPDNPNALPPVQINETRPPISDELILGVEHEVNRNLAIGADFTYRKNHRENWRIRVDTDDPSFWRPETDTVTLHDGSTQSVTFFEPVRPQATEQVYKERPGFNTKYTGVTLFLEKRLANRWLGMASFTYANPTTNYDAPLSFTDPTNVDLQDGRPDSNTMSATYFFKLSGVYQLPAGFSLAGFFQVREGYIFDPTIQVGSRANGAGQISVLSVPTGEERLPTFWNLDLRLEKALDIADRVRGHFIVDAFNLTNNDTILGRAGTLNASTFNRITEVVQGRTVRFGIRVVLR